MDFIEEMRARGLVAQITHEDELTEHLKAGKRTAYIGFDPTGESLHVGHLFQIMTLARWQRAGHRAIALMGGGTALVGDPTGKAEMRPVLSDDEIARNIANYRPLMSRFLDLSTPAAGILVNNADWLKPLPYLPFLREIGSQFSVNRMLTAECFKTRLETGLSFLEFNYMLLQSYDFLHLFRAEACTLQMGGDDQWSNILSGMDLVRRLTKGKAFCLTTPLLTTSDGKKMGKTEKGAVWLDARMTSPYEYFQYWRNVPDDMVEPCLRYFTFLPMKEVLKLGQLRDREINDAKVALAYETTRLLHGEEPAAAAKATADQLFAGGGSDAGTAPEFAISATKIAQGINIIDLLVEAKVLPSKSEARRLIQQGGLLLNGEKVSDINMIVTKAAFGAAGECLLKKGKKHYYRLRISP